jgi:hypothetical protein
MDKKYLALVFVGLAGCGALAPKESATKENAAQVNAAPALDKSGETDIAYAIEVQQGDDAVLVKEDHKFHSGDRFRLLFRPDFDAHIYVVNRGRGQSTYQTIFPRRLVEIGTEVRVPGADIGGDQGWMRMDAQAGNENLILIAATVPLDELDGMSQEMDREEFEARLATVERKYRPTSSRRFEDKDWVKVFAARGRGEMAIILRLPLEHR